MQVWWHLEICIIYGRRFLVLVKIEFRYLDFDIIYNGVSEWHWRCSFPILLLLQLHLARHLHLMLISFLKENVTMNRKTKMLTQNIMSNLKSYILSNITIVNLYKLELLEIKYIVYWRHSISFQGISCHIHRHTVCRRTNLS